MKAIMGLPWCVTLRISVLATMSVVSGCGGEPVEIRDQGRQAVIHGTVVDARGSPVAGVSIDVTIFHETCGRPDPPPTEWRRESRMDGTWGGRFVTAPSTASTMKCLRVIATPDSAMGLERDTVSGVSVQFVSGGQVPDTATIDQVLEPQRREPLSDAHE